MWLRAIPGLVLLALGAVWLLQGVNVLHGSGMSGHHQYALLGAVAIALGAALLVWAARVRQRRPHIPR
jgi:hypothetical protein